MADEGATYAVALRAPLVLDDDRAADRIDVAVELKIVNEVMRQRAPERGDGNGVVQQGRDVRGSQLQGRMLQRRLIDHQT